MRRCMLAGIGENAGVVDIGDGWAVTFKVESHNHPSYVEPYQGAATGVGGIVRDIMAMGPGRWRSWTSCGSDPRRHPTPAGCSTGWCAVSVGTETPLGLPNIGGETVFDASYAGNRWSTPCASECCASRTCTWPSPPGGNKIILFGARTGLDGIGGVSVLASDDTFAGDESGAGRKVAHCPASRSVTRSPRKSSSNAAWICIRPGW